MKSPCKKQYYNINRRRYSQLCFGNPKTSFTHAPHSSKTNRGVDKLVEFYERLLASEKEKNDLLQGKQPKKQS
jgi:hypothetical protein